MYGVFLNDARGERLYREYDVADERRAADVARKLHESPFDDRLATVVAVVHRNGAPRPTRYNVVSFCRSCGMAIFENDGFRVDEHGGLRHLDCG